MEEVSLTIDEAKLRKMADKMLRQRCTSGDEHQYHVDQMKNFLKSDIVWESRKEILVFPHPQKTIPLVHSCQKDHEAPALSLINQDLLYLKNGNSGPEKIVLSLHKFPAIIFNDDDIEEQTSKWVNKKQKEPGKPKEEIYSNLKIVQPNYKNLNKNDIEDIYLLIMNGKHEMFSIIYEHVHGIIYKNSKKEKRVMRHSKIHKFCDAMLNRVLEGLKSYNNDVKYGYVQKDLTKDETEYLKLFEEEIEERLKHQRQMRIWEIIMNQEEIRQVTARDEKWVPTKERVKISTTNVRLETTVPQKKETFQFWCTVKKVTGTNSYEFHLANKKCVVDVEVFQKILEICSRVQGVDFAEVPDDETTLTLLIDLGYKGLLYKHPIIYVDHMHQPWRTLVVVINKCLSRKAASNDRLRKSRIDIL
ncbi:hypothetical protein Tco_1359612 [Tanacetum coccineum]